MSLCGFGINMPPAALLGNGFGMLDMIYFLERY